MLVCIPIISYCFCIVALIKLSSRWLDLTQSRITTLHYFYSIITVLLQYYYSIITVLLCRHIIICTFTDRQVAIITDRDQEIDNNMYRTQYDSVQHHKMHTINIIDVYVSNMCLIIAMHCDSWRFMIVMNELYFVYQL